MAVESGQRALVRVPSIRSLAKLTQAVAAASDLDGIYSAALGSLSESLGVQRASILLFDPDQTLRVKAWLGLSEEYCRAVEGHTAWTPDTTDAQPILSPDVPHDPSLAAFQETFERERIAALAFIPLVSQRRLLGEFMLCFNQPHDFQEDEILLAQTIASQVALAIDQHNVRRELEQRQHQYKHLVDSLGLAVYTTNAEGRIQLYNQAAVALWGRRPEAGKDKCGAYRVYSSTGVPLQPADCPIGIALRENRPVTDMEILIERPDGSRVRVLPHATPLRDQDGRAIGAVNVLVDITARKRAEEDLMLYREIYENSQQGIAIIDPQGFYREQNEAHARLIGYSNEELKGKTPAIHLGQERFAAIAQELQQKGVLRGEVESRTKDGRSIFLDLSAFSVRDEAGAVRYHVAFKRDVTERKLGEAAIKRSLELRDQFLNLVSHELRTPISTILGNGLLLLAREDLISREDRKIAYADIVAEARKLQENVEHLLLLTKLESGDLELQPVALAPMVRLCIQDFLRQNPLRKLRLEIVGEIPPVTGQEALVRLVLQNLLSNADKYSPPDAVIEIRIGVLDDGEPQVTVRDHGIGLDEHDMENLFTPFYRSSRARYQAPGMGLGLAVCKRVLEAQGGTIEGHPAPDGGAEFSFTLPRTPAVVEPVS